MISRRARINWSTVRQRVAQSESALEKALDVDPGRLEAVFRTRAVRLAMRNNGRQVAKSTRILVFLLGQERYGIEVDKALGVAPFADCTPVPAAPPEVCGIVHFGGVSIEVCANDRHRSKSVNAFVVVMAAIAVLSPLHAGHPANDLEPRRSPVRVRIPGTPPMSRHRADAPRP